METAILYLSFALSLGLSATVAMLYVKLMETEKAMVNMHRPHAAAAPNPDDLLKLIERVVKKEMPGMLGATFESGKIQVKIERLLQAKVMSDAVNAHVKQACDDHYRQLAKFVEDEVLPQALERSGAIQALKLA
jgi:hypothetical protein